MKTSAEKWEAYGRYVERLHHLKVKKLYTLSRLRTKIDEAKLKKIRGL